MDDEKIVSDSNIKQIIKLINKHRELINNNPELKKEMLYRTGIYDKDGNLKSEFE